MTSEYDYGLLNDLLEQLNMHNLEELPDLIHILVSDALQIERQAYLGANPNERTPERRGRANNDKIRFLHTTYLPSKLIARLLIPSRRRTAIQSITFQTIIEIAVAAAAPWIP